MKNKSIIISIILISIISISAVIFINKEVIKEMVSPKGESSIAKVKVLEDAYKPIETLKTIEDISETPEIKREVVTLENGSIQEYLALSMSWKSYSWILVSYFWTISNKEKDLYLNLNQKTASGIDESSWMPTYKDEIKEIKINFADSLILDDKRNLYSLKKEDIKVDSKYEVYGIEIVNPANPQEKAYIFYKFTPEDIKIKNESLLMKFAQERDDILSKWGVDVPQKLKELNIKYWFSSK